MQELALYCKGWFNERRATQKLINERHLREELDNEVK